MPAFVDLTGKTFNRLTVISKAEKSISNKIYWNCVCSCGNKVAVISSLIQTGRTKSCGCFRKEVAAKTCVSRKTHGMRRSPEYVTWQAMKSRCLNSSNPNFHNYGGRGISVCNQWFDSFENFFEDMGKRPTPKHSIDRIDNDGNYTPENCKWSTMKEQSNNRRTNNFIGYCGMQKTITQWSEFFNVKRSVIEGRRQRGLSIEDIFEGL